MKHKKKQTLTVLFIVCVLWWLVETGLHLGTYCFFKGTTGLPCPGCGMTRAFIALAHGNVAKAFYWHPLWPIIVVGFIYMVYVRIKRIEIHNGLVIMVLILTVGTYLLRMCLLFPNSAPMDFNRFALLARVYDFIKTVL